MVSPSPGVSCVWTNISVDEYKPLPHLELEFHNQQNREAGKVRVLTFQIVPGRCQVAGSVPKQQKLSVHREAGPTIPTDEKRTISLSSECPPELYQFSLIALSLALHLWTTIFSLRTYLEKEPKNARIP